MSITLNASVKSRRANIETYNDHPDFKPLKGEICFVDAPGSDIKIKVGDGENKFNELGYSFISVITGYYYEDEFYYDEEHTAQVGRFTDKIYIDVSTKTLYYFDGLFYVEISCLIGLATEDDPGIMKLYNEQGQNLDGTMTQKSITKGIDDAKFYVDEETLIAKY